MKNKQNNESGAQIIKPEIVSQEMWPEYGKFSKFDITEKQVEVLQQNNIEFLFPIQVNTYKYIFKGKDLIGKDRTGSGKTLAFSLPLIEQKRKQGKFQNKEGQNPLILVILPTRELAMQVEKQFFDLKINKNEYRTLAIYGGTKYDYQKSVLKQGVEIVVGTPGRLKDLLQKEYLSLKSLEAIILDETDELLNMGFQRDIQEIVNLAPVNFMQIGQFIIFSATVPDWVKEQSKTYMKKDKVIVDMVSSKDDQSSTTLDHYIIQVDTCREKYKCIPNLLKKFTKDNRSLIFSNTKNVIEDIAENIKDSGFKIDVLSSNVKQYQRERVLKQFKDKEIQILIATDVAARGIHVDDLDLIIQFSPPKHSEQYIHRSGRTGRAGRKGTCVTLVDDQEYRSIQKIKQQFCVSFKDLQKQRFFDEYKNDYQSSLSSQSKDSNTNQQIKNNNKWDNKNTKRNGWKKDNRNSEKEDNYKNSNEKSHNSWNGNKKSYNNWNDDKKSGKNWKSNEKSNNSWNDNKKSNNQWNNNKNNFKKSNNKNDYQSSYLNKKNYNDDDNEYENNKVCIFNLPYGIDEQELKDFLDNENIKYSDVYLVKKDGESKGMGFVQAQNSNNYEKLLDSQFKFKGRSLKISKAKKRKRNQFVFKNQNFIKLNLEIFQLFFQEVSTIYLLLIKKLGQFQPLFQKDMLF